MPADNRYHEVEPITRAQAKLALSSEDPEGRIDALLSLAYHDPDWEWVQDRCIEFTRDTDPGVRGMAALCLGHLARIHRHLDLDRALPVLHSLRSDPLVASNVNDALDDIEKFVGRR